MIPDDLDFNDIRPIKLVEEPIRYIEDFKNSGADLITVHVEACKDLNATIKNIKVDIFCIGFKNSGLIFY